MDRPNSPFDSSRSTGDERHNRVDIPAISVPKGGGAVQSIAEKFAANPVTGTGSMTVPIPVTGGRSDFQPELELRYDSGAGNGPFGYGWRLSLSSIVRKTDKGLPQYHDEDESDVFIISGAEDLVPWMNADGSRWEDRESFDGYVVHRYRPRIEATFARIERWTAVDTGETHWRTISPDNVTSVYGRTAQSRIAHPDQPLHIFEWLLCESRDDKGNAIVYHYAAEDGTNIDLNLVNERNRTRTANRYLERIVYGNRTSCLLQPDLSKQEWLFEIVFDYDQGYCETIPLNPELPESEQHRMVHASATPAKAWSVRPDPFSTYRAGFEIRTYRRCHGIFMFHHFSELGHSPYLVKSMQFDYSDLEYTSSTTIHTELAHTGSTRIHTVLHKITQSGYVLDDHHRYIQSSLPPLELTYSKAEIQEQIQELEPDSLDNLPIGIDGSMFRWIDLNGEGLPGILTGHEGGWYYKPNRGEGRFGALQTVATLPAGDLNRHSLLDLEGDGQLDFVSFDSEAPGYYERTAEGNWTAFRPFKSLPPISQDDPNIRFIDLNGDGHADVLIAEEQAFTWHPSLAKDGFGPARRVQHVLDEELNPRLVFANQEQAIYAADMNGDGLMDLVRVRNGEVVYWPNIGYGRFGPKVAMDEAPWFDGDDQFHQQRLHLADIDGSGVTDMVYTGRHGTRIYFNQSGNSWSKPYDLRCMPQTGDMTVVMTADLLGNGTACLIWSSARPNDARNPLRYIDLMGGGKPHLLIRTANQLGTETHIHYCSSTRFYIADLLEGRPWITKLPFPVHVVERVQQIDRISRSRFESRYAYHHGYFDGGEREFRGFGMVETWDTEHYDAPGQALDPDEAAAFTVPPVYTKTWYHTGAFQNSDASGYYGHHEYYREPQLSEEQWLQRLLTPPALPEGLPVREAGEAARAFKGLMLRQETYARDGSAKEPHPYAITEHNYTIRCIQPAGKHHCGVFFPQEYETLQSHYERNPADPRVLHTIHLQSDDYGNVTKSVSIGYGRSEPDEELDASSRGEQQKHYVLYHEHDFTNAVDEAARYRLPSPCETRTYELTGYAAAHPNGRFRHEDLLDEDDVLQWEYECSYEEEPGNGKTRRMLARSRTLYRPNDLGASRQDSQALLPVGQLESLALPGEHYELALTPGLIAQVYQRERTGQPVEPLLPDPKQWLEGGGSERGGYVDLDQDGHWWIRSGRMFYTAQAEDGPYEESSYAAAHFYLPLRFQDGIHEQGEPTDTIIRYDGYDLLVQETIDAAGNRTTVGIRDADPQQPIIRQGYDYRVMQPVLVMDANRNCTAVAFDALGMMTGSAVMGKPEEQPQAGDTLEGFAANWTGSRIRRHLLFPVQEPAASLGRATTRMVYDLYRYMDTQHDPQPQPAAVCTMSRETHESALQPGERSRIVQEIVYFDGWGREIQVKTRAAPGPVPVRDLGSGEIIVTDGQPEMTAGDRGYRWVGTGWTVYNNKGNPVKTYEPFFSDTHLYDHDVRIGVGPILIYDPLERVIGTIHPNGAWDKVVFDAWKQEIWDVNDTCANGAPSTDPHIGTFAARREQEPDGWYRRRIGGALGSDERQAAEKAAVHADTPMVVHYDSLGRSFLSITHNKARYSHDGPTDIMERKQTALIQYDLKGNELRVTDAMQRAVMAYRYDMTGRPLYQASMESGERWMLPDGLGNSLLTWDSRGQRLRIVYDALRRPVQTMLLEAGHHTEKCVQQTVYGETLNEPERHNARGRTVMRADQSGIHRTASYDFKGNLLEQNRQLAAGYKDTLDWSRPVPLEDEIWQRSAEYDALNRTIEQRAPDQSVLRYEYNEAQLLRSAAVQLRGASHGGERIWTPFVEHIAYDAKGQRETIQYGNGASTRYTYDPQTYRLRRLLTVREDGQRLQDLNYTYDAAGNIVRTRDDAQQMVFFRNHQVEPHQEYTYDALYQLIEAAGREHLGQTGGQLRPPAPPDSLAGIQAGQLHPGDGQAMGTYIERYSYDEAGNLLRMEHQGSGLEQAGWTRVYTYAEASQLESGKVSNRLSSTRIGGDLYPYRYDRDAGLHGCMTAMPHLPLIQWDFRNQLKATSRQAVAHGGTVPEITWYVYDATGQRVRKVTDRMHGADQAAVKKQETLYWDGFEIHRRYGADGMTVQLERETLHILDDQRRIATVETRTQGEDEGPGQLVRYSLGNHLDSASLELDGEGRIVSYEEYYPFGSTSYQGASDLSETPKRYRYIGKERDEESGFYYCDARYYISWLGRWLSCDPGGMIDGPNLYRYARNSPVVLNDPGGMDPPDPHQYSSFEAFRDAAYSPYSDAYLRELWDEAQTRLGPYSQRLREPLPPGGMPQPGENYGPVRVAEPPPAAEAPGAPAAPSAEAAESSQPAPLNDDYRIQILIGGPYTQDGKENRYGHVALRVITPDSDLTYDYGRYGRTWGTFGSEGEGILNVYTNFNEYIRGENATGRTTVGYTFRVSQAQAEAVNQHFAAIRSSGTERMTRGSMTRYRITPDYHALESNCTTISLDPMELVFPGFQANAGSFIQGNGMNGPERFAARVAGMPNHLFMPQDLKNYLDSSTFSSNLSRWGTSAPRVDTYRRR